ncbi:MAG: hypothetical protein JW751_08160 [Polyangiaceae bacterium]|nr:hypothetical protein [Polyangiaceae bacterium]
MTRTRALSLVLTSLLLSACRDDTVPAPVPYVGEPPENVLACGQVRDAVLSLEEDVLATRDGPAACAADGLECALGKEQSVVQECSAEEDATALCVLGRWVLDCRAPRTGEGSGAGFAGATGSPEGRGARGGAGGETG